MLPRAQDIALLCRHWLKGAEGVPQRERLAGALRALQELLGATGAALSGPGHLGYLAAGDLSHDGAAELLVGPDGVSRKTALLIRSSTAVGEERLTMAFRFPLAGDEAALGDRIALALQAFAEAAVKGLPAEEARFADYQLLAKLGEGGMGQIHLARAPSGELVALKRISRLLAAESRFLELFAQEVQAATQIAHPNVVRILEYGVSDGQAFLVMEYLQGASLARASYGALALSLQIPWPVSLALAIQYAHGLEAAHRAGVIHCDVSPQNLFVTFGGEAKVIDFGLARTEKARADRQERARGKLGYVAPEQLIGQPVDHRGDLFSLGVVLYELLSARPLEATWRTYAASGLPPLSGRAPELPRGLSDAVMRAVAFAPEARPSSARAWAEALAAAAREAGLPLADAATISVFMRDAVGDTEAQQKRLATGKLSGPVTGDSTTTRLD